jgi:predicted transcriptional regulator
MRPSLKALPPVEWSIMCLLWQHGPLTVQETQKLSPRHSITALSTILRRLETKGYVTTTSEASPTPGRRPDRFHPRVDYLEGLETALQQFLTDYTFNDPQRLSLVSKMLQGRLSLDHEVPGTKEPRPAVGMLARSNG